MSTTDAHEGRRLSQLARIDVAELRGIGDKKRQGLEHLGITKVLDLLLHYPRRYADRTKAVAIDELAIGEQAMVSATVVAVSTRRPRAGRPIVEAVLGDDTGRLKLTFFNQPWRARQLREGQQLVVVGKVDTYRGALQMANPIVDLVGDQTGRIVPIYRQSEKARVSSSDLANYIDEALKRSGNFADPLSEAERRRCLLVARTEAFRSIHQPKEMADKDHARRRLAFDELWRLQVALVRRRRELELQSKGISHVIVPDRGEPKLVASFLQKLPFSLTSAQRRVIGEVAADLKSPLPMNRLLQGEVGSGKTVVALAVLCYGVQGGFQGALMVPTEVLAEQHYLSACRLLEGLFVEDSSRLSGTRAVRAALLTSHTPSAERQRLVAELRRGEIDLVIGTHALLTDDVEFSALGIVVIDEQHRFGVDQRAALREKASSDAASARDPDLLVMTATPIPRTAAMLVYGDLDYSVLDELPARRSPIRTRLFEGDDLKAIFDVIRREVTAGRQAFVICPLVNDGDRDEELDKDALYYERDEDEEPVNAAVGKKRPPRSATSEFERLRTGPFADLRLELLHGQLASSQKAAAMAAFQRGEVDVLVATTVIEVGIDVPNATVMVVLDADRFGIAQLHQLRGRVGRGAHQSECFLVATELTDEARLRLEALVSSNDGFELAEKDLELRGEGTLLGARQKGRSDLKLASLRTDRELLELERSVASELISADPELVEHPLVLDELSVLAGDQAAYLQRS